MEQLGELLAGLGRPGRAFQLLGQKQADLFIVRGEVGELLEGPERLVGLAGLLHPVGVLEQVLFGLRHEPPLDHQHRELEVDVGAGRCVAQDLVAQRDGVVGKAVLGVQVGRPLVCLDGLGDLADLDVEIADLVEERKLSRQLGRAFELVQDLEIGLDGLLDLALILELPSLEFDFLDVQGDLTLRGASRNSELFQTTKFTGPGRG